MQVIQFTTTITASTPLALTVPTCWPSQASTSSHAPLHSTGSNCSEYICLPDAVESNNVRDNNQGGIIKSDPTTTPSFEHITTSHTAFTERTRSGKNSHGPSYTLDETDGRSKPTSGIHPDSKTATESDERSKTASKPNGHSLTATKTHGHKTD